MTWQIVLRPNFDSDDTSIRGTYRISSREFPTRESASATEQGIAAGGRWWGKVLQSQEVAAYVADLQSAGLAEKAA